MAKRYITVSGEDSEVVLFEVYPAASAATTQEAVEILQRQRTLKPQKLTGIAFRLSEGAGSFDINIYAADNNIGFVVDVDYGDPADCPVEYLVFRSESAGVSSSQTEAFVDGPIGSIDHQMQVQKSLVLAFDVTGSGAWEITGWIDLEAVG